MQNVWSVFSTSWWTDNVALYGSTTVSDTYNSFFFQFKTFSRKKLSWRRSRWYLNVSAYFWWRHDWKWWHYAIRIFFANLWYEQCAHAWPRTTAQRMSQLKSLQAITVFGFFSQLELEPHFFQINSISSNNCISVSWIALISHHIQHRINQFGSFCIMALCPVVTYIFESWIKCTFFAPVQIHWIWNKW